MDGGPALPSSDHVAGAEEQLSGDKSPTERGDAGRNVSEQPGKGG